MKILIQDTALKCFYFLSEDELEKFSAPLVDKPIDADLIFVIPNDAIIDELQPTEYTDGPILNIAVVDTMSKKLFQINREQLELFEIENADNIGSDVITFSIPSSMELFEQVDLFRRALVQNSS